MSGGEWFTGPFQADHFAAGRLLRFADATATVDVVKGDGAPVVAEGRINGAPIAEADRWLVPAWCERDGGREATTVYVDSANIIAVRIDDRTAPPLPPSMARAVAAAEESLSHELGLGARKVFDPGELDTLTAAVLVALRSASFRNHLDPMDVDHVAPVEVGTRHGVRIRLADGRTLTLTLGHFTATSDGAL